ncbi:hypothetical protein Fcan01_23902 [Folsomia candida]|uniref:Uncharacterized protein n=1 Tax=Folsomia candida TaxID=158441 RepID=A0A226D9M4_FOLCA|nr:hypothetical protein Fcan01_23902 [Folsomia candida]
MLIFLKWSDSKSICQLVWTSSKNWKLDNNTPTTGLLITRAKLFGIYQTRILQNSQHATFHFDSATSTRKLDILQNLYNCSLLWTPLSKESLSYSVPIDDISTQPRFIGRTMKNGQKQWSVCQVTKVGQSWSTSCIETSTQKIFKITADLSHLQVLTSFKNTLPNANKITLTTQPDLLSVRYPGTDFIRNKADVTVTQTLSQTHSLEKSVRTNLDTLIDVDIIVRKDVLLISHEEHWVNRKTQVDKKSVTIRRTITLPARTSVKSCTILEITNSPIQVGYLLGDSQSIGTIIAAEKSVVSSYIVEPVNARRACVAVLENDGKNSLSDLQGLFEL